MYVLLYKKVIQVKIMVGLTPKNVFMMIYSFKKIKRLKDISVFDLAAGEVKVGEGNGRSAGKTRPATVVSSNQKNNEDSYKDVPCIKS